jgi:prepilin-type N-terminal cleavage/methylation domain-containing protein
VVKKSGFTLIELMVVIGVLGCIIMLTTVNFNFLNEAVLHQEVEKLYAACMHAQQIALTSSQDQIMLFDLGDKTYTFNGHKERLPQNIEFGYIVGAKGPPSSPINTIINPVTFKSRQIVFSASGIISPGTIYLTDTQKHHMYALSSPISQVSYLRKYRYDSKWGLI